MPSNTTFDPKCAADFDKSRMIYSAQGVKGTATVNSTTNIDLALSDDYLLTGFWISGINIAFGDSVDLQITDPNNMFGLGANAVIRQFASSVYLPFGSFSEQFEVAYPAKVFAGLNLRVVYHSCLLFGTAPEFAINYKLHKVLV